MPRRRNKPPAAPPDSDRWVEMYQDKKGRWRWRVQSPNGRILADSAQGYVEYREARERAEELHPSLRFSVDETVSDE